MLGAASSLLRLARFGGTLARSGALRSVLDGLGVRRPFAIALAAACRLAWPFGQSGDPKLPPIPRALVALGPVYIKFGQSLATRPDIVGPGLASALRPLQDRLPPFPMDAARETVRRQLGKPVDELFREFDPPVAAASIAQVHPAVDRRTGARVAVKILRPGIEEIFRRDIAAIRLAARILLLIRPELGRLRPLTVVNSFERSVTNEMNLLHEAAAAAEYGDNLRDDPGLRVAAPVWQLSARRVLTTSWEDGTPIDDLAGIRAAGETPEAIAARLLQLFLRCALRDGLFHGDMHQGNLRVASDGCIVLLDFGIMGRLDDNTRRAYAEILYGFLSRDYRRAARAHRDVGYLPADQDLGAFAQALRTLVEPIFGEDASRISMGRVLAQLFSVTERFGMRTQPQLLLLQKTMMVVEGVARGIDPHLDIWKASEPVVTEWIESNVGPRRALSDLAEAASMLVRLSPQVPALAERLLAPQRGASPPPDEASVPARWGFAWGVAAGLAAAALLALLL